MSTVRCMRRFLPLGLLLLLAVPATAGAAPAVKVRSLPPVPMGHRTFQGMILKGQVVIWANVRQGANRRVRIWQLRDRHWRVVRRYASRPPNEPVAFTSHVVGGTAYDYDPGIN